MNVSIIGASGYTGGELLRLLLSHPKVTLHQVTSERYVGKPVTLLHPNLRKRTLLKFTSMQNLEPVDLLFVALPHTESMANIAFLRKIAPKIIDLSADFRLHKKEDYEIWYGIPHAQPDLLEEFVYGIVELHREEMRTASLISSAGCNATATILSLYPLIKHNLIDLAQPIISEAKCGSSEAGNKVSEGSHHPERSNCVRSYKPTGHRHTAEMIQELGREVFFSATAIDMVRGILVTSHAFTKGNLTELDIWKAYRAEYDSEPFIRVVKDTQGIYRYPEPKLLTGTNYCDIGFELEGRRIVIMSAIDNLMKGAAGQAVHAMNVMCGFEETTALDFPGLHPI